jgi:predicted ATPase
MSDTIKRITIEGFKSIRKLENFELRALNVLIGANGAGKSNFVEFFRLLRALVDQKLQVAVATAGGVDACLYLGPKVTKQLVSKLVFLNTYGYEFTLLPTADNRLIFSDETVVFHEQLSRRVSLGSGQAEAKLKDRRREHFDAGSRRQGVPNDVYQALSTAVAYHFHDTSTTADVRRAGPINHDEYLHPDAGNLAALLYRIRRTNPGSYERIRDVVRLAAPFFDDFKLRPMPTNPELIQLEWSQRDFDYPLLASQLSDGTLRFICLATALLQPAALPQPALPQTVLFDEPELGLHPYALTLLASLFQQTAQQHGDHVAQQVIVSTQSAQLLNEFDPEDVIVVERTEGESIFTRLDSKKLSGWLEDYSLGELWQKNVVGGGPRNEAIPLPPDEEAGGNGAYRQHGTSTGDERP